MKTAMGTGIERRNVIRVAFGGVAAATLAAPHVRAQTPIRWRMVTSWPRGLPGVDVSARRIAERIAALSGGRLIIDVFAAGEIVPAFAVHDAVSNGTVEVGHTASFFMQGKIAASAFFTTVPFGLDPVGHLAWIAADGQALWDELYAGAGLHPFLGGNTSGSMAGWFRKPIASVEDLKGLRIRVSGLGSQLYARLGAIPQAIPPGDVYAALERGTIDAVELLGPVNDRPLGLHRIAPHYLAPGFNKPNGASELIVGAKAWEALGADLQAAIRHAAAAEHAAGLGEATYANAAALKAILGDGAKLASVPVEVLREARKAAAEILREIGATSPLAARILDSYGRAVENSGIWAAATAIGGR